MQRVVLTDVTQELFTIKKWKTIRHEGSDKVPVFYQLSSCLPTFLIPLSSALRYTTWHLGMFFTSLCSMIGFANVHTSFVAAAPRRGPRLLLRLLSALLVFSAPLTRGDSVCGKKSGTSTNESQIVRLFLQRYTFDLFSIIAFPLLFPRFYVRAATLRSLLMQSNIFTL